MSLKRNPFKVFYGWWIVAVCFTMYLYVGGIVHYGFTAIFEPIHNEFGWSYAQISLAASLRGMEAGFLTALAGFLVDRWGPRRLMFTGSLLLAIGLFILSRTNSLGMFYSAFVIIAVVSSTCVGTVPMTAVAHWFRRKVGLAIGIISCGSAFSGLLVPVIVKLIDTFYWRTAVMIFSLGALVLLMPLSLLIRHKPEKYGYLPDGEANDTVDSDKIVPEPQQTEIDITAKQAFKGSTFWHITLALTCHLLILNAVITHVMPYLGSVGFTRSYSGLMASAIPIISMTGRLGSGWLGDRFDKRWVTSGHFVMISLSMLLFSYVTPGETWSLILFLILFGFGYGGNWVMMAAMTREYFGRRNFGTINGCMMGIMALGGISGPLLAGWTFDTLGSYHPIWLVFASLAFIAFISVVTTRPVTKPGTPTALN